jgi:hypothetical protein
MRSTGSMAERWILSGAPYTEHYVRCLMTETAMSDDTVTVELEVDPEMLDAMRRIRRNQRTNRDTKSVDLEPEDPTAIISGLLGNSYHGQLRKARNRGASGGPVGADSRYSR